MRHILLKYKDRLIKFEKLLYTPLLQIQYLYIMLLNIVTLLKYKVSL